MASRQIPQVMRKIVCTQLSPKFRESTSIIEAPIPQPGPKDVLIQNQYVGINASDINYTAGRYDATLKPPFDIGFEGIGEVVAAGDQSKVKVGQSVLYMVMGAFTEYKLLPAKHVIPVPSSNPKLLPFPVSGLTAAISLDKVGEIQKGEKVLVTAAAGGTGQFAVQLAKLAGCHVIGTCSSEEKVKFLKSLGCDRPINYKVESVKEVLKKEYPGGIDVVYESVGGEMFDTCVNSLATKGRLIVIGYISGYESQTGFKPSRTSALPQRLLPKSASVRGFFLFHYTNYIQEYMAKLITLLSQGKLQSVIDQGETTPTGPFVGLDSVADAIDYMYQGTNKGKVVVQLKASTSSKL
ncbi:prostaglandin reductase-3-like [Haliotis rufescens]|uniref:prostaglandin reductase-3-like n=1 Tax=Haliotis rufescens TaxID=6454 RepID=UPI00201F8D3B|nr:prostaglandin reductase-3-like [Haliotis rufescens]